jgi:hypothetical protein
MDGWMDAEQQGDSEKILFIGFMAITNESLDSGKQNLVLWLNQIHK